MNFSTDKGRKRILGSMLPQHVGESVCLLGTLVQLDPSGKMLKMKTTDDHLVTVQLQQPKMKLIKLSPDDPDIFLTQPSTDRCNFITSHFEAFMQMYKSQGSIFWLRFLVSYKVHTEEKFCDKSDLAFLMQHFQFIRVLNYIYINIHKKFIEGSNTAVKKLMNNLVTLTLNSPSHFNLNIEDWLVHLKNSKQLHTTFQNLFGIPEPSEYLGFTHFISSVFTDFFCALCAVFEQWYKANDLNEDEVKKVDSKVIYWLPPYDTSEKFKPLCFEKYLSDYWKGDLQRMLMTDNIHNLFSAHKTAGCCEKFDKEKNIYKVFQFSDKHMLDLMKVFGGEEIGNCMRTVTEICMKDLCILKPQVVVCTAHESCFVKICHSETCCEPFICKGEAPCTLTCESKIKNNKKTQKQSDKFWKTVSVEIFPVNKSKCDASTLAESYNKDIQTYLHLRKATDFDIPFSMMRSTYHCLAELHNFDFNPRRTECLKRLRKKLSQKHPLISSQFNPNALRQSEYHERLFENAMVRLMKLGQQYCASKGHNPEKCDGNCFCRDTNTVAVNSTDAFGRVIFLSRKSVTIPFSPSSSSSSPDLKHEPCSCKGDIANSNKKMPESNKKSTSKKANKANKDAVLSNKLNESSITNSSSIKAEVSAVCEPASSNVDDATISQKEESKNSVIDEDEDEYSPVYIDDDIDEICKLIGIDESDNVTESGSNHVENVQANSSNNDSTKASANEDELVENFLKLIGVNDSVDKDFIPENSKSLNDKAKLKICAYCAKKEPRRKTFKKCSRCKEDNFPIHHYYCSTECLMEDWSESHEEEHARFKKQLS